jgi:hypothetical protein
MSKNLTRYSKDFPWIPDLDHEFKLNIERLHHLSSKPRWDVKESEILRRLENSLNTLDGMRFVYQSLGKDKIFKKINASFQIFREEIIDLINFTHRYKKVSKETHRKYLYDLLVTLTVNEPVQLSWLHIEENTTEGKKSLSSKKEMKKHVSILNHRLQKSPLKKYIFKHFKENKTSPFRASARVFVKTKDTHKFLTELFKPLAHEKTIKRLIEKNYFESSTLESPTTFHLPGTFPLILSGPKHDVTNLVVLAHEMAHAVHYLHGSDTPLVEEFIGLLFEMLAFRKMQTDPKFKHFKHDGEEYFWHNFLDFYVQKLYSTDTAIKIMQMSQRNPKKMREFSKNNFSKYFGVKESYFDFGYELNENFYSYDYLLSFIYSYHIALIVSKDPSKWELIRKILVAEKDLTIEKIGSWFKLPNVKTMNEQMLKELEIYFIMNQKK